MPSPRPGHLLAALLAATLLCAAPALRAQPAEPAKKELTEKTSAGFAKLRPLLDAKDYDGALALIDGLLAAAARTSYDAYLLSQIRAQILLTQNRLAEAVAPLENALRLGDSNPAFFEASASLEQTYLLAQLHYQVAADRKEPAAQRAGYESALALMNRWIARAPRATSDSRLFCASLLYTLGTLDPAKPDAPRLREAITQAREALLLSVRPSSQLQLILVACHLQLGENARAAELLEVLAEREPKSATTWQQLQSLYLAAAAETKDTAEAARQNLRALITLDRAQALGHLSTPRDHYTRVAILFNLQQFSKAAALLEKGLADGTLENARRNWELLASAYQQTAQDERALDAMNRAVKTFPADAALEFSLAQFLYGAGRVPEAYARAESALQKPGLEKPGQASVYLAYLAYELQRYEEATRWIDAARQAGGVPAATLDPIAKAVAEAVARREALKKSAG